MKILRKILLLAVAAFLGMATSGNAMQAADTQAEPKPLKLIVKLKPSYTSTVESTLSLSSMEVSKTHSKVSGFLRKHHIQGMMPLHPQLIAEKRRTGKSETDIVNTFHTRFKKRGQRHEGKFNPPTLSNTYVLEFNSAGELEAAKASLALESNVLAVYPDQVYKIQMTPNDTHWNRTGSFGNSYQDLYGLHLMRTDLAWDVTTGAGVLVAVLDTGIDYNHPDIAANVWTNPTNGAHGYNFISNTNDPMDDHGHGSHCSGTIAAVGNNNTGVIGVAWNAKVMGVKGLNQYGQGDDYTLAQGIRWAADHGADVISMSWGREGTLNPPIDDALAYAHNLGVVLVAAAGNSTIDASLFTPANNPHVITVSAFDSTDHIAFFSDFGSKIDVAAPGVSVLSLHAGFSDYITMSGTSMAAPHVAGLAALILSQNPSYTNEEIRQVIRQSADDVDAPGWDKNSGYGRVNAARAVAMGKPLEAKILAPGTETDMGAGGPIIITGTARGTGFSSYTLEYGLGYNPTSWTLIANAITPVQNTALGSFDPRSSLDGRITVRLTVKNILGRSSEDRITMTYTPEYFTSPAPTSWGSTIPAFKGGAILPISGTAFGADFQRFRIFWTQGINSPAPTWSNSGMNLTGSGNTPVTKGLLARWDTSALTVSATFYTLRMEVDDGSLTRIATTYIYLDPDLASENWPQFTESNLWPNVNILPVRNNDGSSNLFLNASPLGAKEAYWSYTPSGVRTTFPGSGEASMPAAGNIDGIAGDEIVLTKGSQAKSTMLDIRHSDGSHYKTLTDPRYSRYIPFQGITLANLDGSQNLKILSDWNNEQGIIDPFLAPGQMYATQFDGTQMSTNFPLTYRCPGCASSAFQSVLPVDLDGDGQKELVVLQSDSKTDASLKLYNADGTPKTWAAPSIIGKQVSRIVAADLDGTGEMNIIIGLSDSSGNSLLVLRPDGTVKPGWPRTVTHLSGFVIGDLNRDGKKEIVYSSWSSGIGLIEVLMPDGSAMPGWPHQEPNVGFGYNPALGDLDGDGYPEIVLARATNTKNVLGTSAAGGQAFGEDPHLTVSPMPEAVRHMDSATGRMSLEFKMAPKTTSDIHPNDTRITLAAYRRDGTLYKEWRNPAFLDQVCSPFQPPVIGDFSGTGTTQLAFVCYLIEPLTGGFVTQGAITVFDLKTPYHRHAMPWPSMYRDSQNSMVLPNNKATFVSQVVPSTMSTGQTATVTITMKNTGNSVWTKEDDFALGSTHSPDNMTWGLRRVSLDPADNLVGTNEKTFTFDIVAPSTAGVYHFQWKMTQDGVGFFNEPTPTIDIIVTGDPIAPVISTFTATPKTIVNGSSSTLAWMVTGATNISINQGVGTVTSMSSTTVRPSSTTIYTLSATNDAGTVTSTVTVTVTAPASPPMISQEPQDTTVTVGATATFSVSASGTAPLSYQWFKNGSSISGAMSSSYTTPSTTLPDDGSTFHVVVTNITALPATSRTATLHVNSLPTVATPSISPNGGSFSDPVSVTITCATLGAKLTYTVDGSSPIPASLLYSTPFTLSNNTTVRAKAFKSGMNDSAEASLAVFDFSLPAPDTHFPATIGIKESLGLLYAHNVDHFEWTFVPQDAGSNARILATPKAGTASFSTPSPRADLASRNLHLGPYVVSVRAMGSGNLISPWSNPRVVTLVDVDFSSTLVFPNPWRAGHTTTGITFNGLPPDSTVKIFTVSGHWMETLNAPNGSAKWELMSGSGQQAASGIYLFVISDTQGNKSNGKFTIIR